MRWLLLTLSILSVTAIVAVFAPEEAYACRDYDGHRNWVVPPDCSGGSAGSPASYGGANAGDSVEDAIYATFPASLAPTFVDIAACESGFDPDAYNPDSEAFGPFQFLPTTEAGPDGTAYGRLDDPYYAAQEAYELYLDAGFSPWVCA